MRDHVADCHASGTVRTVAFALGETGEIALCGHCLRRHRTTLTTQGWVIISASTLTATRGTGTEATGAHYALEG